MKPLYVVVAGLFLMTAFFSATFIDTGKKNSVLMQLITKSMEMRHFAPKDIDDKLSNQVFHSFLEQLDKNKVFFLQSDIKALQKYHYLIDDEINSNTYQFFDTTNKIITKRILETEKYYQEILAQPFNFDLKEKIELDADKKKYADCKQEQRDIWRKWLKYQALGRLYKKIKIQEDAKNQNDTTFEYRTFSELEENVRKGILTDYKRWFKRLKELETKERRVIYINSFTHVNDPHTDYMLPKQKKNFEISMSGRLEGIGATLQELDGYVKVVRIVPGSASWKQGELKANDVILKVGQADNEPVSIVDMRLDNAVKMIRGKKGTEVRLTVKKPDGEITVIPIIRDVVVLSETYAKSVLIEGADNRNIGYIFLPKFYADFGKTGAPSSANDVRKELEKLKNDSVAGVIIDLRSNGGGSLDDAVKMAGLFIEKGPVVQVKARGFAPLELKDPDPNIVFKKPVVIMVNSFSASASEILSAALQDYGRAVIIGSSTTYGKGTVQRIYNFDDFLNNSYADIKPLGSIKLTTQKFYRINGGATQLRGVTADIILPDAFSYVPVGENEFDSPMPWDEIKPANYERWQKLDNKMKKLKKLSKKRISRNKQFKLIEKNAKRLKKIKDKTKFTLNLANYQEEKKKQKKQADKYKNTDKVDNMLKISFLTDDYGRIKSDTIKFSSAEKWHKKLSKDIYLQEAIHVLDDIISIEK